MPRFHLFLALCAIAFSPLRAAVAQDCFLGKNLVNETHCAALMSLPWKDSSSEDVELTLLGGSRSLLDCDHHNALVDEYNTILDLEDAVEQLSAVDKAKVYTFSIGLMQNYALDVFFEKPQYLALRLQLAGIPSNTNTRYALIFAGGHTEGVLEEIKTEEDEYVLPMTIRRGEFCFGSDLFFVVYDDIETVGTIYRYRKVSPIVAMRIAQGKLVALQKRPKIYRDRWTDTNG